ncbi:STAS-like domain-containing protein [Roseibium sp.]|uniref:STAS-like domain-containing protein n=1 Tax=Roseibium sp. TaxID=1936156 RepID=UPI003B508584
MGENVEISIAKDYSPYPAGRDDGDGPFNGSKFRDELLKPAYLKAKCNQAKLTINLDGMQSFGSSFLEEAFGGLVRKNPNYKSDLINRLTFTYTRPSFRRYEQAIKKYLSEA